MTITIQARQFYGISREQLQSFDLNKDGRVTQQEVNDTRDYFDRVGDRNGSVNGQELDALQNFIKNNSPVGDINRATSERLREGMRNQIDRWGADQKIDIVDVAQRSRGAARRYIEFAKGASDIGDGADLVGGLAGVAATTPPGQLLAVAIPAAAKAGSKFFGMDFEKVDAELATRFDADTKQKKDAVDTQRDALLQKLDAAGDNPDALRQLEREIGGLKRQPIPTENEIFRDLLFQHARQHGQNVEGSAWHQRNFDRFYHSYDWGNPFSITGIDIAGALNNLPADTYQPTRINR